MAAGMPRIEVKFLIDANGILQVTAREQRSGKQAEIEVHPSYGLTDEQVESMILDSFDQAEEDLRQRQVIEARSEAQNILGHLDKAKKDPAWGQLTTEERRHIAQLERELREVAQSDDYAEIRNAIDELDRSTLRLAELRTNSALASLKGKAMNGIDVGEGPDAPHPISKADFE